MSYGPSLSNQASCSLRRIAWALKVPMTQALEEVLYYFNKMIDGSIICKSCLDSSKCKYCDFHASNSNRINDGVVRTYISLRP
jgi:hypothetical protein